MEGQDSTGWDRISQILQKCFQICFLSDSSTKGTEGWWLCSYRIRVPARFKHLWHRSWTVLTEADWWDQLHRHMESPGNAQKLCGCGTWGHGVAVSLAILKRLNLMILEVFDNQKNSMGLGPWLIGLTVTQRSEPYLCFQKQLYSEKTEKSLTPTPAALGYTVQVWTPGSDLPKLLPQSVFLSVNPVLQLLS